MDDFNILDNDNVKIKTNYVIAVTMLTVGVLMLVSIKTNMAYVFIFAGILLLYVATAKRHDRKKELDKVRDMKAFRAELEKGVKFEVGIAEGKEKALFLTDNVGGRHRIARTVTGDGKQSDFDDAYRIVKSKFAR